MMQPPKVHGTYLHQDDLYRVIELARHADNGEVVVVYRSILSKEVYARPLSTWEAEKFVRMPDNVGGKVKESISIDSVFGLKWHQRICNLVNTDTFNTVNHAMEPVVNRFAPLTYEAIREEMELETP